MNSFLQKPPVSIMANICFANHKPNDDIAMITTSTDASSLTVFDFQLLCKSKFAYAEVVMSALSDNLLKQRPLLTNLEIRYIITRVI